jgi:type IV pilus assembly protein PilV
MLLLAIGVLGLAGSQLGALKYNQTAAGRTQASFLAYSIADAMRANKKNASSYIASSAPADTSTIANQDLTNWYNSLSTQLPVGTGSVACSCGASETSYTVTITVQWDEGRNAKTDSTVGELATDPHTQSFVMVTQI